MIVLFLQEVFWVVINRFINSDWRMSYHISEFRMPIFLLLVAMSLVYIGMASFFSKFIVKFPRFSIGGWFIWTILSVAIVTNCISAIYLAQGARYNEGGLTGIVGVLYAIAKMSSIMVMVVAMRGKWGGGRKIGAPMLAVFITSMALTIDGLATALTTAMFLFIMTKTRGFKGFALMAITLIAGILVMYVGFWAKFSEIPTYLTPEFAARWSVARMSISAESLYKFLSGESMFNESMAYVELLRETYLNRYDVLIGNRPIFSYPRSISEGLYMDMYGVPGAGSSPGFYLGVILHGLFSPIVMFVFVWLFMQMFYGYVEVIGYIRIYAISFVLKIIHANITDYLVIISPLLLVLVGFAIASLIEVRGAGRRLPEG